MRKAERNSSHLKSKFSGDKGTLWSGVRSQTTDGALTESPEGRQGPRAIL